MEGMSRKGAFILGYSGEIGRELLKEVTKRDLYSKVVLVGRRKIEYKDENLAKLEQRLINFDEVEKYKEAFKDLQVGFCCLGTTRAEAGAEGFYRVDHDYVINAAKVAKEGGCEEFHLVTSQGANKDSMFLYNKTKGQVEKDAADLAFKKLFVYRPSILLCDREKSRPLERAFKFLLKPIFYTFPTFISVPTTTCAKAIATIAANSTSYPDAVVLQDNKKIHELGV